MNLINEVELKAKLPQAFATTHNNSAKYKQVNTAHVVGLLAEMGWYPTKTASKRSRNGNLLGKHLIEFQSAKFPASPSLDYSVPRILLTNSHDASSSFRLMLGLFRLVCSNGLVVSNGSLVDVRINHVGFADAKVRDAVNSLEAATLQLTNSVSRFMNRQLTRDEQLQFAVNAAQLKFPSPLPFSAECLLHPKRVEDQGNSLWHVLNRVQERLIRGGISYVAPTGNGLELRRRTTREVRAIDPNIKINQGIWALAERLVA